MARNHLRMLHLHPEAFIFLSEPDKIKHMVLSAAILAFDFAIRYFFVQKKSDVSMALAYAVRDTLLIGLGKEAADMSGL